jgi:large subunit ribosomal protein L5
MKDQGIKKQYEESVVPELMKDLGIKNKLAVPRITKIVVNMGIGDVFRDKGQLEKAQKDMSILTGQMPSVRTAKISVAGFNLRRGMPVGLKVTLRGKRMYDFLQRLIAIVLPRLRDFRGIPLKSFDKSGNYTLGIAEHTVFPEIDITKSSPHGLEISIVTSTESVEEAKKLLTLLGMPFEKEEEK